MKAIKTAPEASNDTGGTYTPAHLLQWRQRIGLSAQGMSDYVGVPVFTWRKWETGERVPDAAPRRLFEVLGLLEAMAPAMHEMLLPKK